MKSFLSTKESLDRLETEYTKTINRKVSSPKSGRNLRGELMFYIRLILRGKRKGVKWASCYLIKLYIA